MVNNNDVTDYLVGFAVHVTLSPLDLRDIIMKFIAINWRELGFLSRSILLLSVEEEKERESEIKDTRYGDTIEVARAADGSMFAVELIYIARDECVDCGPMDHVLYGTTAKGNLIHPCGGSRNMNSS